jgi:sortase A
MSGAPVIWLRIPGCGIDELVLYQDTLENLNRHPSLAQKSPMVILGHRDTHFRKLQHIQLHDSFDLESRDGDLRTYRVSEIEILPAEQMSKRIENHRDPTSLVLVTCHPFTYLGPAPNRLIVWAQPI